LNYKFNLEYILEISTSRFNLIGLLVSACKQYFHHIHTKARNSSP